MTHQCRAIFWRENKIVIVAETDDEIYVSTLSSEAQVRAVLQHYYPGKRLRFVPLSARDIDEFQDAMAMAQDNIDALGDDSVILESLLVRAVRLNASDIHIEPRSHTYTVFFRLLGVRQIVHEGNLEQFGVICAQVKDRSRMDQVETRVPQDGSFSIITVGRCG